MAATRPYSMKGVCGARGAPALATGSAPRPGRTVQRPSICRVLAFTTGSSNGQGPQENSSNGAGKASSAVVLEAPPSVVAGTSLTPQQQRIFEELAASPSAGVATTTPTPMQAEAVPQAASQVQSTPAPAPLFRADEAWQLFEERLEADLKTVRGKRGTGLGLLQPLVLASAP